MSSISSGLSRFVALPHTEGCGHSSGDHEALVVRSMLGYGGHPLATFSVFLEHGCEKTHNGRFQLELEGVKVFCFSVFAAVCAFDMFVPMSLLTVLVLAECQHVPFWICKRAARWRPGCRRQQGLTLLGHTLHVLMARVRSARCLPRRRLAPPPSLPGSRRLLPTSAWGS